MQFTSSIIKVCDQTHDVKSFQLTKPQDFTFIPGQYCMVSYKGLTRPFTFTSIPSDEYIELTIKKMAVFTSKLFTLEAGDEVGIAGPHGDELNFEPNIKDDVVFVAGGSGITPFISAIRYAKHMKMPNNLILLYANRTQKDIILKKELEESAKVVHILSNEDWEGETGYVDADIIRRHVEDPKSKLWFVCGPPPMTAGVKNTLTDMGIENIRIEPWELLGKTNE